MDGFSFLRTTSTWWLLILRILSSPQLTHEKSPSCRIDLVSCATNVKMPQLCAVDLKPVMVLQFIYNYWRPDHFSRVIVPVSCFSSVAYSAHVASFVGSHSGRCGGWCWRRLPVWLSRVSQGLLYHETDASGLCSVQYGRHHVVVGVYSPNTCYMIGLLYALKMHWWIWQMWLLAW